MNLVGKTRGELENQDKARKKNLIVKSPEEDKDQDLTSKTKDGKCKQSSEHMRSSKTSISESDRLRQKLKFQEKGQVEPRIEEIGIFSSVTILNNLGYWDPKGWSPHHKSSQNRILSPSPTTN